MHLKHIYHILNAIQLSQKHITSGDFYSQDIFLYCYKHISHNLPLKKKKSDCKY